MQDLEFESPTTGEWFGVLTAAGRQALAEYDAHYTTVESSELARLQALERKIEAFWADEFATDVALDFQTGRWTIERRGQTHSLTSLSDAMRIAFEIFEVPSE